MKKHWKKILGYTALIGLAFGLYVSERILQGQIAPGGELVILLFPLAFKAMTATWTDFMKEVSE